MKALKTLVALILGIVSVGFAAPVHAAHGQTSVTCSLAYGNFAHGNLELTGAGLNPGQMYLVAWSSATNAYWGFDATAAADASGNLVADANDPSATSGSQYSANIDDGNHNLSGGYKTLCAASVTVP